MAASNVIRRSKPTPASRGPEIRSTVFNIQRADESVSRQIVFSEEFISLAYSLGGTVLLPTPYSVERLFQLIDQSNMIRQCIDAMVTNTVLTGWEAEPTSRGVQVNQGEKVELESFIAHANSDETLSAVMAKVVRDEESVGFGFLEVIRDATNAISLLRHATALYTRLCTKHPTDVLVEYKIYRGRRISNVREYKKFRRFTQVVNGHPVWFKEFGDPRRMSFTNGAFEGEPGFDPKFLATEIYHFKSPSTEWYGVPQWINQLPNVLGSREAEEVNMRYFQDNTVPPMLLLVGNGRLTAQSHRELQRALNDQGIGAQRQNKIMLLEAMGEGDSMDGKSGTIELKVEKLTDARQSDGLFKAYDEGNMAKVRSSFRLPPVLVGMSHDITFASANVSVFVAESQVFAPARQRIDDILNKQLVNGDAGMALKSVKLVSRTPSITSPEMIIKTMTALNVMGAVTPRSAQGVANKLLQMELVEYPKPGDALYEEWMDKPIVFAQRGPRGSAYDPGAEDAGLPGGADGLDENGDPIVSMTPTGQLPKTQSGQSIKDPLTKQIEKDGNLNSAPKHGQE